MTLPLPARALLLAAAGLLPCAAQAADPWLVVEGGDGPGKGKHIVLISGDEEYRSEEALPQLARILAQHHGFTCTVLFAIDPKDGTINPNVNNNIPGLEALKTADLMVIFTRFRNLPDEQMKHVVDYVESGRPIIGMRTATHAFNLKNSKYQRYSWQNKDWPGGFGKQVLGETWVSHHGQHGKQSTRGIFVKDEENHPILKGIQSGDIWGATDVYGVRLLLSGDSKPLVLGAVLEGMDPKDKPVAGKKNDPMMPVAWVKTYNNARVFGTTMGHPADFKNDGFRRMVVNACYWALGMESKISPTAKVDMVGEYSPNPIGLNKQKTDLKPVVLQ